MELNQYSIILVNLERNQEAVIRKTRPCVVISPDEMNRHLRTIVVAPMTTRSRNYPTRIRIDLKGKSGWVVADQIRTIDRQMVIRTLGTLTSSEIGKLKKVIRNTYVD